MSLRSLPAITLVTVALLGAPVAATAVTISSIQTHSSAADAAAPDQVNPAVWAWAATGLIGLGAMVTFGATVMRRSGGRGEVAVEAQHEVAAVTYA